MTARIGFESRWFGQWHPRAKLTDRDVELVRKLRREGMGYAALAEKFDVSRWCIGRICRMERRIGAGGS